MRICAMVAMLTLAAALPAGAQELELKLTVDEVAGIARTGEPASGGVPLPWGRFKADQEFTVYSGQKAIPAQVLPLVVDEKGFIRWVLIDTQVDVAAKGKADLTLKTGRSPARPAHPLKVSETADGVTVDTGTIAFTVSKSQPFGLFSSVQAGSRKVVDGGSVSYTDVTNADEPKTYQAGPPELVETYEVGPMRATVKAAGRFVGDDQTKMQYIAWITAWAGTGRVHVKYILANSNPDQFAFRMIGQSQVALNVPGGGKGGEGGAIAGAGSVSAHDLYFKEKQPRAVEADGGKLLLRGVMPKDQAKGNVPWATRALFLPDSTHYSSQYVIDFVGGDLAARAEADKNVLHIMAPLEWYSETGGVPTGKFGTQADEIKCYETWEWKHDPSDAPQSPAGSMGRRPARYIHWEDNHYESEQDIVESLLLMYLRTGSRSYFVRGRAWANYNMDLQNFRTDGWRYKDGAVWWNRGGPSWGNRPQRAKDPVTGFRNSLPNPWSKSSKFGQMAIDGKGSLREIDRMSDSKQCYCHNYGAGLAMWFCLTGERDALEALIDSVEQNYDSQYRARGRRPGKVNGFSRDFTRTSYLTHAARLVVPTDEFVVAASDYINAVYVQRPQPEPRGLVKASSKLDKKFDLKAYVGQKGLETAKQMGVEIDEATGMLHNTKTGQKWYPVVSPHTWMYTYQAPALDLYARLTGDETAMDHGIAYGQAVAHVLWQEKHGNLSYGRFLVDFPRRGFAWDPASWQLPADSKTGEGVTINGYLARFHPDIPARAYSWTGEPILKQRAYDYWWGGSHRGYNTKKSHNLGGVGAWVNIHSDHSEYVTMTGRTFHIWAHPRRDSEPPQAISDLKVTVSGDKATVEFTAPADRAGGKVARYQVKCSDREIAGYEQFLGLFNEFKEEEYCNWFLATNLDGEPAPAGGGRVRFTVSGVPEGAKFFAVRSFDDSNNRSGLSNLAPR